jgi:hypothetical protein
MKQSPKPETSRRDFLKKGVVTVLGAGCFGGVALEELLAAAQRSGKPLLTTEGFTARIPAPRQREAFRKELEAIRNDLVSYVDTHFHLVPGQIENFRKIPREDIKGLNKALTLAEEKDLKVVVQTELVPATCSDGRGFRLKTIIDRQSLIVRAYRG